MVSDIAIYQALKASHKVLLVTHYHPDGDALSSLSAMIQIMKVMHCDYHAFCAGPIDKSLSFLAHIDEVSLTLTKEEFAEFDVIVSLDCGSVSRTGIAEMILARRADQSFIEIDHHPKVESVSDIELRVSTASATGEVIYNFCQTNQININSDMATCILTGLATDTGGFVYPATSRAAIGIAAQMLWRGAHLPTIIKKTFYKQSLAAMRLWGLAMARLTINERYQIAYTVLTCHDFEKFQANEAMTDELAGWLACLDGVRAVLFLKETKPGLIKGSWRSVDPKVDVSKYARSLGGGGHAKAAGFAIKGRLVPHEYGWKIENV